MAYRMRIPDQWVKSSPGVVNFGPVIYNVDQPVGSGCPNRSDDVLLVQYFITMWAGPYKNSKGGTTSVLTGTNSTLIQRLPRINGVVDGVTITWIMLFQLLQFPQGRQPDGRVDPASPGMSPHHPNTILLLNMWGKVNEGLSLPVNMPPQLQTALQNVR